MRETEKTVEIQGRTWKIRAFDALTGSYIAFQLFQRMMPGGLDAQALTALGEWKGLITIQCLS